MGQEGRGDSRLDSFDRYFDARAAALRRALEAIGEAERSIVAVLEGRQTTERESLESFREAVGAFLLLQQGDDAPPEEIGREAANLVEAVEFATGDHDPIGREPSKSATPSETGVSEVSRPGPPPGTRPGFLPTEVARLLGAFVHDLRGHNSVIHLSTRMARSTIADKYSDDLIIIDLLEDLDFIRVNNQNITNLLTAMASLSRDWTEEPLTKEVVLNIHEQLVRTTDFEFDVEYPENVIINDLLIYADGFFSMSLLILQDLLNSIGSLREPRMSIRYMILGRELMTVATFPTTPSNQHHPVPFRKDLTRFITDAFRGKLASSQVDGSWEVCWSFPLEGAGGRA